MLGANDLHAIDAYWRAANYCSVGQIYLLDNPLLREPLRAEHIKPRLMGHFGTTPGLNLVYAHLNRVIVARDLDMIYVIGPGHGGPGIVANTYLEGTYSEVYPHITQDEEGLRKLFRQFSFPGGIPSHVSPGNPGSIHEGGELGYSLVHAYGAAFDNPDLIVACVIGDGEAETGPLAASWHSNKFLDPVGDGAVLPILHLNGYKIANPTVLARIGDDELRWLLEGYGHRPIFVAGDEPFDVHEQLASRARSSPRRDRRHPDRCAPRHLERSSRLAHDRLAYAERVDVPQDRRRPAGRGHVPRPPGACRRRPDEPRASRSARNLDAQLPVRGALRRGRALPPRAGSARTVGHAPHGRQPPCQRRAPPQGPHRAGLHPLRGTRRSTGHGVGGADEGARGAAARRHHGKPHDVPLGRTGRNGLEPARGSVRGHRTRLGGRGPPRRRAPRKARSGHGGPERAPL